MSIQFLQEALEEKQKLNAPSLIKLLKETLETPQPHRGFSPLHASSLTKESFCARQVALLDVTKKPLKHELVPAAMAATFDIGHAISDLIRNDWLGDLAVGDWTCSICGKVVKFSSRPPDCKHGGRVGKWEYNEVVFWHGQYEFVGSIDMLLRWPTSKLLKVVEIKIMTPVEFEKIIAPLAEHRIRTNLYMHLIESSKHLGKSQVDTQEALVLYVSRAYGKKHDDYNGEILPFKEFTVKRNDLELQPMLSGAASVNLFRTLGHMPEQVCPNTFCPRAKSCPVLKECFSGKYPATVA